MTVSVDHVAIGPLSVLGVPIKLSATPGAVRSAPPTLGQHTEAVLKNDLGMSKHDVDCLRAAKAI
jgi:crotonobetainyl-CoA:carnitine CoA-transferase CaiB-like acyl-CoA transferase